MTAQIINLQAWRDAHMAPAEGFYAEAIRMWMWPAQVWPAQVWPAQVWPAQVWLAWWGFRP